MVARPARPVQPSRRDRAEWWLFILLVAPNLLLLMAFTFWPMLSNIMLSFVEVIGIGPNAEMRWVGLANYERIFGDRTFQKVLSNTLFFTFSSVALTLLLGLAMALLLNQPLKWRNAARAVLFTPTVLSGAAIALVWIYIFDPRFGLLREILAMANITSPQWLSRPNTAMWAVIIVYVWKSLGYAVVIYLAGLQAIDRTLYEAAEIDGAGSWARFWNVTLPGLSPIAFFLLITSILSCFQAFDIIRVMTRGGPVNATNTIVYYLYERGFERTEPGTAGVVAVVMFIIMLILTVLQLRFVERRVTYA
jgi:multiple sugar transport system permease protein/sn-glycerol 3-phosphate transport system permease protein